MLIRAREEMLLEKLQQMLREEDTDTEQIALIKRVMAQLRDQIKERKSAKNLKRAICNEQPHNCQACHQIEATHTPQACQVR